MKKILYTLGLLAILLFYFWTKELVITGILLVILDSFTICFWVKILRDAVSDKVFKIVRISWYFITPIVISIFIRSFFIDMYFVPSKSMERTLSPGDYVIVNKFSYGVKLPRHMRNIPVIGGMFQAPKNEYDLYRSLKGGKRFQREDIVVFKAVDDSDKFLIKRMIGMPGDSLKIVNGVAIINNQKLPNRDNYSFDYISNEVKNVTMIKNLSVKEFRESSTREKSYFTKNIKVESDFSYFLFPRSKQDYWTIDNYGSLIVPKKGLSIELTKENIQIYKTTALKFENVDLENYSQKYYSFRKDYYFMLGDNRHNSIDSRSFGFVPETYIQGKMISIF